MDQPASAHRTHDGSDGDPGRPDANGSLALPVSVLLELKLGLFAGGIADIGGLLVILALLAMWIGIVRYTGEIDAARRFAERRRG